MSRRSISIILQSTALVSISTLRGSYRLGSIKVAVQYDYDPQLNPASFDKRVVIGFNPLSGLLGRLSAPLMTQTMAQTSALSATASSATPEPGFALQRPRAPFASGLVLAVSMSLFGPALSGCGRTGLLGPEDDAPVAADAGTAPRDAGAGGDGNTHDAGPIDAGTDAGTPPHPTHISDLDCDGIPDLWDNCPLSPNADQMDTDGDGIGDVCDNNSTNPDSDGDGILDGIELFQLGTDPTKADTDGDGIPDGADACPTTAGPAASLGCQPSPPTCAIEAVAQPSTLCDGTMVHGFRILWNTDNAGTASLKEGAAELTRKLAGQVYVYPPDSRTYEISAASPFGNCLQTVTVTP